MDITDEMRSRVELGTIFLNEKIPGWRDQINVEMLDLSNPACCVLGQLYSAQPGESFGGYTVAGFAIHDWLDENDLWPEDATGNAQLDTGFERDGGWEDYESLTVAWLEVIADRV